MAPCCTAAASGGLRRRAAGFGFAVLTAGADAVLPGEWICCRRDFASVLVFSYF